MPALLCGICTCFVSNMTVVLKGCQITGSRNSRTGNSGNTRSRNTRSKRFHAYQIFIRNTEAILFRISFICCIYQTFSNIPKIFCIPPDPEIPDLRDSMHTIFLSETPEPFCFAYHSYVAFIRRFPTFLKYFAYLRNSLHTIKGANSISKNFKLWNAMKMLIQQFRS